MNKLCKKCDTVKPVEGFSKDSQAKDGLMAKCKTCDAARNKAYRGANPEKVVARRKAYCEANLEKEAARKKAYREANLEKARSSTKAWAEANLEKARASSKAWREANPEKEVARTAKRRAAKLQRTPEWLTQEHHDKILAKYAERDRLNKDTGIQHHVDHIVPLQGENISGLHVPWNLQVITAAENQQKSNSY